MATTIRVPYEFATDSSPAIRERWEPAQGFAATVRFRCAWGDRGGLARDLMGIQGVEVPFQYPDFVGVFCLAISDIVPIGKPIVKQVGPVKWSTFEKCEVVAEFGVPPYNFDGYTNDPSGQPWITTNVNISGEYLQLPDGSYYWETDGTPVNLGGVGKLSANLEIVMRRKWAPKLPLATMNSFLSVLNAEEFVVGDLVCPPETVMFMGGPSETTINTNLQVTRDLEYRFLVRDESWNKLFHPTPGLGWQYVNEAADGGGFRIFDVDSFDELFHFEP